MGSHVAFDLKKFMPSFSTSYWLHTIIKFIKIMYILYRYPWPLLHHQEESIVNGYIFLETLMMFMLCNVLLSIKWVFLGLRILLNQTPWLNFAECLLQWIVAFCVMLSCNNKIKSLHKTTLIIIDGVHCIKLELLNIKEIMLPICDRCKFVLIISFTLYFHLYLLTSDSIVYHVR